MITPPTSLKITGVVAQRLVDLGILVYDIATDRCKVAPHIEAMGWEISLGFEHVAIKQKKNKCTSRLAVDIASEIIKGVSRPIPLIAANMSTVCDSSFCIKLYKLGALGVMHRAAPENIILEEIEKIAKECKLVAGSVGVGESQIQLAQKMIDRGCNIIFIDIAHGYADTVIDTGRSIKDSNPDVKIVIGNTTNINLMHETKDFVDAIKCGIATGSVCETKNTAGCNEKQFSAILKFKQLSKEYNIPIIGDGGIREPADLVKGIGAGANSVMAGSIFARCPESAAPSTYVNGEEKKIYSGMASRFVQDRWRGGIKDNTCPEGGTRLLDLGESADKLLERWSGALRSGITYAGGSDIQSFQKEVEFVRLAT